MGATIVHIHDLHFTDVPHVNFAVCVCGKHGLPARRKHNRVASILMPVKCVGAVLCPGVPEGDCLVPRAGGQGVGEGKPCQTIHTVDVPPQSGSASVAVQIPNAGGVIQRARSQEVPSIVETGSPDSLGMVFVGGHTLGLQEIPHFDSFVPGCSSEVGAPGVEIDGGNPILVVVSAHDELPGGDVPQLPCLVIGRRGSSCSLWMHRNTGHGHGMPLVRLPRTPGRAVVGRLESDALERVGAVFCGPGGFASRLLLFRHLLLEGSRIALLVILKILDGVLKGLHFDRQLVAVQSHKHLLLHAGLILVAQLQNRWFVFGALGLQSLDVVDEPPFLLHHSLVACPVEIAVLFQLFPSRLAFLCYFFRVLELLLDQL
mmetsp:Transcript_4241/g.7839  ORF Transcript_4241/g.7839 Transcript_4241/m.7839 type:complete len:373 (+) Transcript_4241:1920-3038(+)